MVAPWLITVMVCTVALPSFLVAAPEIEEERGKVLPWRVRGEEAAMTSEAVQEVEPQGEMGLGGLVADEDGMIPGAE